jgi:hypothetical protein
MSTGMDTIVRYFANPCGRAVIEAMRDGHLGFIDTPAQGNVRPDGIPWCADNGAFSDKFDEGKWWRFLVTNAHAAKTCMFAVAPDVVGDAAATLERSLPWLPKIRDLGYPAAFVAQDGFEELSTPWDEFDVLFIGGRPTGSSAPMPVQPSARPSGAGSGSTWAASTVSAAGSTPTRSASTPATAPT